MWMCLARSVEAGESPNFKRERHWAVTSEKFELFMERLRLEAGGRGGFPVVLSHGFFVNSAILNFGEEHSLARHLAREGFDVWNLSFRGSGRSLNPLGGGPRQWTLDDIIEKDVAAVIRYVQQETKRPKLFWVGYEMGGLVLYGYLGKKRSAGLAGGVTLGAPVSFNHSRQELVKKLLHLEESPFLKKVFLYFNAPALGRLLIPMIPKVERLFYNPDNIEEEVRDRLLETALMDINPGVLDHLLLMIKRGEFVAASGGYNYRKNLNRIGIPLLLIAGEDDRLAPPDSIREIYRASGSADRTLRTFGPRSKDSAAYGHFDLIAGKKAPEEVYPVISKWLRQRDGRG